MSFRRTISALRRSLRAEGYSRRAEVGGRSLGLPNAADSSDDGLLVDHRAIGVQARADPPHLVRVLLGRVRRQLDANPRRIRDDQIPLAVVYHARLYDLALRRHVL